MKLSFFLFLLLIPTVNAIAVSPAHADFIDNHATLYLIPERPATYIISGDANYQEVIVMNTSIFPLYLTLNQTAHTEQITITEKPYNANALTLLPGISLPYTIEKKTTFNKITGNVTNGLKTVLTPKTKQIIIGVISAIVLLVVLRFLFPKKKKEKPIDSAKPFTSQETTFKPAPSKKENPKFGKVTQRNIRRKR